MLVYYYSLRDEGMKVTLVGQSSVAQFPPLWPFTYFWSTPHWVFSLQHNATRSAALNGSPPLMLANALPNFQDTTTLKPLTGEEPITSLQVFHDDFSGETLDLVGFMGQRTTTWALGLGPGVSHQKLCCSQDPCHSLHLPEYGLGRRNTISIQSAAEPGSEPGI